MGSCERRLSLWESREKSTEVRKQWKTTLLLGAKERVDRSREGMDDDSSVENHIKGAAGSWKDSPLENSGGRLSF